MRRRCDNAVAAERQRAGIAFFDKSMAFVRFLYGVDYLIVKEEDILATL